MNYLMAVKKPKKTKKIKATFKSEKSNLVSYAQRELQEAGLFDKDSDYSGMIGNAVLDLVKMFSSQGHSGFSAEYTLHIFNKVISYHPLVPLKNPIITKEYMEVGEDVWQSTRLFSVFSNNQGKTWYDINGKKTWANKFMKFIYWSFIFPLHKRNIVSKSLRNYFWEKTHKAVKF